MWTNVAFTGLGMTISHQVSDHLLNLHLKLVKIRHHSVALFNSNNDDPVVLSDVGGRIWIQNWLP